MAIAIYLLESSIVDFAGSVIAVEPGGTGMYFDAPHLHDSSDKDESLRREQGKRVFLLGGSDPAYVAALRAIRKTLKRIAVPMVSANPIKNSDGIDVRQLIVYRTDKADLLVPKLFAALPLGSAASSRCRAGTHVALSGLDYQHCPIDGLPLSPSTPGAILPSLLKEKRPISEIRVEEPAARKSCAAHRHRHYPNCFIFCPECGARLAYAG